MNIFQSFKKVANRIRITLLSRRFGLETDGLSSLTFGRNTFFFARDLLRIGRDVYIGRDATIECDCIISDAVIMANSVALVGRKDHAVNEIGTPIRQATSVRDPGYFVPLEERLILIERDVWLGYGVIVLSGVTIGEGAVIGAGSVVTRSIAPNSIAVGNPARVTQKRFSNEDFEKHRMQLDQKGIRTLRLERLADRNTGNFSLRAINYSKGGQLR